jgi:hypothetical protein
MEDVNTTFPNEASQALTDFKEPFSKEKVSFLKKLEKENHKNITTQLPL